MPRSFALPVAQSLPDLPRQQAQPQGAGAKAFGDPEGRKSEADEIRPALEASSRLNLDCKPRL